MKMHFEIEDVNEAIAQETLKGLEVFLNEHVLASDNRVSLDMGESAPSKRYITRCTVEITEAF